MIIMLLSAIVLLAAEPADDQNWQRYLFDRAVNECAVSALAASIRDGGLKMDRQSGHGAEVDWILDLCRKQLGAEQDQQ